MENALGIFQKKKLLSLLSEPGFTVKTPMVPGVKPMKI